MYSLERDVVRGVLSCRNKRTQLEFGTRRVSARGRVEARAVADRPQLTHLAFRPT